MLSGLPVSYEEMGKHIIENGEFPFGLFKVKKEDVQIYASSSQKVYQFYESSSKTLVRVIYWEINNCKPEIGVRILNIDPDCRIVYVESYYNYIDGKIRELERTLKLSKYSYDNFIDMEKSMEDLKNNRYISCSQRVVRDKDEVGIADIEYFIGSVEKYAYERLMLGDEDEILLNSFGSLNGDDVVQKIIESEQKEKDRKKYIEGLIKFGNGTTIENRNRRFIDLVAEGLTLGETIGACSTFVNSLPDSMDPTNCAFIPGEVFFKQPIDLHQLNHRAYSDDNHRTVFGGMITWSNTIKSAQVIALCVIFQKMLLSGRNNYTSSEIISIMKEYQLLKSISENYTQKYREYLNKRNDLLRDIAKKMVEKFNLLRGKSGSERIFIIKDVYKEIERARGKFSLSMDMKMYLDCRDPSNKISSTVNFGAIAEIGRVKLALDSIYYKNGVSLNSKKLCMIQVATNLIKNRAKAIALVEKNYKFDIRNVDISCDGYAVSKRRFPRQKIFSKK